jgi:predicted DNA-binding transcriptional regulator AlpA
MTSRSNKLLKAKEVAGMLNISEAAVWKWTSEGTFPTPIRLSDNRKPATRWVEKDIEDWLEEKKGG